MPRARRKPAAPYVPPEPPQKPTPEAMAHGAYTQGDSGTRSVWTNLRPDMLSILRSNGVISAREKAAGLRFEETHNRVWGTVSNRDPLDQAPRGGTVHETEGAAAAYARNKARLHTILNRVGPSAYSLLRSVCAYGEPLGEGKTKAGAERRDVFKAALRECATVYGLTDEDA